MEVQLVLDEIIRIASKSEDAGPFEDALVLLPVLLEEDKVAEIAYARFIRELCAVKVVECGTNIAEAERLYRCYEELLRMNAAVDFDSYMLFMETNREAEKRFYMPRRHVLLPLVRDLQDLYDDLLDFLSISMPPRTGKAVAFETPVLTESGWKQHGDLTIRDKVAAPDGSFVPVLAIHPVCEMQYEVEFSNGEKVTCHGEHEWRVFDRHGGKVRDLSVNDMLALGLEDGRPEGRGHRYRFMLENREALLGIECELPVSPYTLGAWLGDGRNRNPDICGAESDYAVVQGILDDGYELAWDTRHKTTGVRYYGFKRLREQLQSVGMCHSRRTSPKYVPECYFTAGLGQRLDLLAGLLDTDGTLRARERRYTFTTAEPRLRDDFVRLVSTFGWRCSIVGYSPAQHGSIKGRKPYWAISFNPTFGVPCRLERKRLREFSPQRRIALKSIRPVHGARGNCITVEGGMYCVGDTLIPTHNSTMCIFFLTFVMGNDPLRANVMSGHSDKLTKGFHMEALSIITDSQYRFAEVFPDAKLVDKSMADETIHLKRKGRFPTLTCRSADGTLTGAVEVGKGALLYCDDLVSDREEALSADRMDKLYQIYLNQLKDRMNDGAKQLFVATRWVPNDPIGRIEEQYEGNPRYRFTVMPALGEDGETNFDYLYGLGFSTAYYEDMRESLVDAGEGDSWAAKYQGAPEWIGGLMFSRDNLMFYDELPEGEPDGVIAACDTKDKGKDYAVLVVAYIYGDRYYIHRVICDNGLPEVVEPRIADALVRNNVGIARFESNSAGGRVADDVKRACAEQGHSVDMRKVFSTQNKETRILVDSLWIKEHCLFLAEPPDADYKRFMSMFTHYTTEGKNKHDDAPDAVSMLKRLATSMRGAVVKAVKRPC